MQLLREAQSEKHPVSLVIDEFQKVAEIDSALPGLFKSLTDLELRGVSLVLSGSRRHVMHELHSGPGAPMLGVGELMTLDLVPEADMVAFTQSRAEAEGKGISEAAAHLLFQNARGVPAYVQRLAFEDLAASLSHSAEPRGRPPDPREHDLLPSSDRLGGERRRAILVRRRP